MAHFTLAVGRRVTLGEGSLWGKGHLVGRVTLGEGSPCGKRHSGGRVTLREGSPLGTGHFGGRVTLGEGSPFLRDRVTLGGETVFIMTTPWERFNMS